MEAVAYGRKKVRVAVKWDKSVQPIRATKVRHVGCAFSAMFVLLAMLWH
jgi:hypothetical protein